MTDQSCNLEDERIQDDMFAADEVAPVGGTIFKNSTQWEAGEVVTGVFLGTYKTWGPPDKPFKSEATKQRIMIKKDGTVLDCAGGWQLDARLANVKPFTPIRIEYGGKVQKEGEDKEEHVFTVRPGKEGALADWVEKARTLPAFDPLTAYAKKKKPAAAAVSGPADLFSDDSAPSL